MNVTLCRAIVVALVMLALSPSVSSRLSALAMVFPGDTWQEATPQSQGIDPGIFQNALAKVSQKGSFVVVRNGYVIYRGSSAGQLSRIYSCGKNFAGTIFGAMVTDRRCATTDLVVKYIPSIDDKYAGYAKVALRHLASMTGGYDGGTCGERWGGSVTVPCAPRFEAGAKYEYWDDSIEELVFACTFMARSVNPAHKDARRLFLDRIASKIGMKSSEFDHNNESYPAAFDGTPVYPWAGAMRITPLAHARLAHLWLNRGMWAGAKVLDAAYVDEATRPQGNSRYGYTWRLGVANAPANSYHGSGYGNNYSFIIPQWKMVVISQNGDSQTALESGFFATLAKGISNLPTHAVGPASRTTVPGVSPDRSRAFHLDGRPVGEGIGHRVGLRVVLAGAIPVLALPR